MDSVEAVTNIMHGYLYSYNITILYIFQALLCSSSVGQIVYVKHPGNVTLCERPCVTNNQCNARPLI